MRAPRYRFPDEVRTATRDIASRMLAEDAISATPEELDSWLSDAPDIRETLERGGYGTAFTSQDLFPLLQAFIARRRGSPRVAAVPARSSTRWWLLGLFVALLAVFVVLAFTAGALPWG
jgi:hypothetical protein